MKTNADKSLELIIQIERLNIEYKFLSNKISQHTSDCWNAKMIKKTTSEEWPEPCLTEWLERKFEEEVEFCPVTGREKHYKIPYWTAPKMTEKDCHHCYSALRTIEERKELKKKRGRLRAQLTKIAKREILNSK